MTVSFAARRWILPPLAPSSGSMSTWWRAPSPRSTSSRPRILPSFPPPSEARCLLPARSSRRLHGVGDEVRGDLSAHLVSDDHRIAEVDTAPDAHLGLFLGQLGDTGELS